MADFRAHVKADISVKMVLWANELAFSEPKRLPRQGVLLGLGIVYDATLKQFN